MPGASSVYQKLSPFQNSSSPLSGGISSLCWNVWWKFLKYQPHSPWFWDELISEVRASKEPCGCVLWHMGMTSCCLSPFHRKLELSPVPGSTEGQSFHISAKPELWSRVMPQLLPPPYQDPPPRLQATETSGRLSARSPRLCAEVAESDCRSAPTVLMSTMGDQTNHYQPVCSVPAVYCQNPWSSLQRRRTDICRRGGIASRLIMCTLFHSQKCQ